VPQMSPAAVREGLTYRIIRVQERQKVWRAPTTVTTNIRGCHGIDGRVLLYREKAFFDRYDAALYHIELLMAGIYKTSCNCLKVNKSGETCTDCFVLQF
jgi:hypothetical protein